MHVCVYIYIYTSLSLSLSLSLYIYIYIIYIFMYYAHMIHVIRYTTTAILQTLLIIRSFLLSLSLSLLLLLLSLLYDTHSSSLYDSDYQVDGYWQSFILCQSIFALFLSIFTLVCSAIFAVFRTIITIDIFIVTTSCYYS